MVEEDYEDSLVQFASIILDPVKESSIPIKAKSSDSLIAWCDTSTGSSNSTVKEEINSVLKTTHDIGQDSTFNDVRLKQVNPTAIYNEPCDAKLQMDDPSTIYTLSGVRQQSLVSSSTRKSFLLDNLTSNATYINKNLTILSAKNR